MIPNPSKVCLQSDNWPWPAAYLCQVASACLIVRQDPGAALNSAAAGARPIA
ncbi:hypothetical protein LZ32DRAFT_604558 [Colletotrichum eremochloae]|nr:hypothetical protein LZ32DRAFT_604558 [Colletotrichum eremochloae]